MAAQAPTTPKIDSETFSAVLWSGTVISLFFLIFRVFVHIKSFRKVYSDDVLVLIAWIMLFVSAVLLQTHQPAMYRQFAMSGGTVKLTPQVLEAEKKFLRAETAVVIMYYTSIWTIKLAFLFLFRRLGQKIRGQKIWWWCVLVFTVGSWASRIGSSNYKCLLSSLEYIFSECDRPPARTYQWAVQVSGCVLDVASDVAIITIPVLMLWNVRISWGKKLGLMAIFSLTVIVIIISIVRITLITSKHQTGDISWLYMWSIIQEIISVIVACLAAFRQLFTTSEHSGRIQEGSYLPLWARGLFSSLRSSKSGISLGSGRSHTPKKSRGETPSSRDSTEQIFPLGTVHRPGVSSNSVDHAV